MKRVLFLLTLLSLSACHLLSGDAACKQDRDCPASIGTCDFVDDSGVGLCVDGGPNPPSPAASDAGPGRFAPPTAPDGGG